MRRPLALLTAVVAVAALALPATAARPAAPRWSVAWATAQHVAGPQLQDQTARTIARITQGGEAVRVRLGHAVGTAPLEVAAASVAVRAAGPALVAGTSRPLTFGGRPSVTVPAGGWVVSDPVPLATQAQQDLAVDVHVPGSALPSAHREAFETSYLTAGGAGDRTGEESGASYTQTTEQFLVVSAVDVLSRDVRGAVVVVGGSVTDGAGSRRTGTLGTGPAAPAHSRWSDVVARRVLEELPADEQVTVAQAGIGGDAVARACRGAFATGAGSVQDRLDRDVLSLSGLTSVVVYAGTNDLGAGCSAETVIAAFRDVVERAHAQGVRVVIATVTPRVTYTPEQNAQRRLVNLWITRANRCGGACDGTVDFDAAVAWHLAPNAIDPAYDSGDTIHPNAEGYALMGQALDTELLRP